MDPRVAPEDDKIKMHLIINGERRQLPEGLNVERLLMELGIASGQVAVERNREIVPKSAYASASLNDGDQVEIVSFIGGG